MSVLLITPTIQTEPQRATLASELRARFGNACYQLPNGQWLVSYDGTSKQFSDAFDLSSGRCGSLIVFLIGGYWGYSSKEVWEWLSVYTK